MLVKVVSRYIRSSRQMRSPRSRKSTGMGHHAQAALLEEVGRGAYQLEAFAAADIARARQIMPVVDIERTGLGFRTEERI